MFQVTQTEIEKSDLFIYEHSMRVRKTGHFDAVNDVILFANLHWGNTKRFLGAKCTPIALQTWKLSLSYHYNRSWRTHWVQLTVNSLEPFRPTFSTCFLMIGQTHLLIEQNQTNNPWISIFRNKGTKKERHIMELCDHWSFSLSRSVVDGSPECTVGHR